jgi:hypothetical protein
MALKRDGTHGTASSAAPSRHWDRGTDSWLHGACRSSLHHHHEGTQDPCALKHPTDGLLLYATILKFAILNKGLPFHFTLGPMNYITGPGHSTERQLPSPGLTQDFTKRPLPGRWLCEGPPVADHAHQHGRRSPGSGGDSKGDPGLLSQGYHSYG